jgi:hypothetical protein
MDGAPEPIMFEVYLDTARGGRCRVVYFTELDEHDRDAAIDAAMAGAHVFDGFIAGGRVDEAKAALAAFASRVDAGAGGTGDELGRLLAPFLAR